MNGVVHSCCLLEMLILVLFFIPTYIINTRNKNMLMGLVGSSIGRYEDLLIGFFSVSKLEGNYLKNKIMLFVDSFCK